MFPIHPSPTGFSVPEPRDLVTDANPGFRSATTCECALGSSLLFLIFFPGTIRQGAALYYDDTGLTQEPFLGRWLMVTAIMFGRQYRHIRHPKCTGRHESASTHCGRKHLKSG